MLSIIIPTYNERENVFAIAERINSIGLLEPYEMIFVDDSNDDTLSYLEILSQRDQRVIYNHRENEKGLGTAVVKGFELARGDILAVLDGDLQHPPELLAKMLVMINQGADIAIATRFIDGGGDDGLNLFRKIISSAARTMGKFLLKPLRKISDPTSGFFMFRKSVIENAELTPIGWKILIEILCKGTYETIAEIPYRFARRIVGRSKMSYGEQWNYIKHLIRVFRYMKKRRPSGGFGWSGILAFLTNIGYRVRHNPKELGWFLFISIFMLEASLGYYLCHIKRFFSADALSRVANAFYVLYIQPPHLASVGFVWNPLPSLLELPLMPLWKLYKPIVSSGLAGTFVTSCFTAGAVVLLYRNCLYYKWSPRKSLLMVLLYMLNPFIVIYGLNGMSEAIFFFCIIWAVIKFTQWLDNKSPANLVHIAVAFAMGFFTRYEAVPFAMALCLGIGLICYFQYSQKPGLRFSARDKLKYAEATSFVVLTPFIYSVVCWILWNWIIQGDPLYFLHSSYSNSAQSVNVVYMSDLTAIKGSIVGIGRYILYKSYPFLPLFVVVLFLRVLSKRVLKIDFLILCCLILSTNLLQLYLLYDQISFGWLRFFAYPFPIMAAWLPYELKELQISQVIIKKLACVACFTALFFSAWLVGDAVWGKNGRQEYDNFFNPQQKESVEKQRKLAAYLNSHLGNSKLLLDSFLTSSLIINLDKPQNLTTTCSYQFQKAVKNPVEYGIQYVLVPNPNRVNINRLDAIHKEYPDLYEYGAVWCVLEKEFENDFRLYRVIANSEQEKRCEIQHGMSSLCDNLGQTLSLHEPSHLKIIDSSKNGKSIEIPVN